MPQRNEVIVTDENLFQVLTYDRLENTPAGAEASKPKRVLSGDNTLIEFQSGLYIDPKNGDIFAPNNDTVDTLVVFAQGSNGDVTPKRALHTPHGTFGIAVDEKRNEMFLTTQHDSTVVVFRKDADKDEAPLRLLQGDDTGLADPHGIAIDPKDDVFFVANYGSRALRRARSGDPHRRARSWQGSRQSELAARARVRGARKRHSRGPLDLGPRAVGERERRPVRVIAGTEDPAQLADRHRLRSRAPRTVRRQRHGTVDSRLRRQCSRRRRTKAGAEGTQDKAGQPTGVTLDTKNGELWVSNFGAHSATAYPIAAARRRRATPASSAPPRERARR